MGKYHCWELKDRDAEPFKTILDGVKHHLNQSEYRVPKSILLGYDVYMIGKTPEKSTPRIMFHCRDKGPREEAVGVIVKSSGLLKSYPGLDVGHWKSPPHLPDIQPTAEHEHLEPSDTEDETKLPSKSTWTIAPPASTEHSSRRLIVESRGRDGSIMIATATVALAIESAGRVLYLAPAHAFFLNPNMETDQSPGSHEDDNGGNEYSLGIYDDSDESEEVEEDEEFVALTSQGSESPRLDATSINDGVQTSSDEGTSLGGTMPETTPVRQASFVDDKKSLKEDNRLKIWQQLAEEDSRNSLTGESGHITAISRSLDYVLLPMSTLMLTPLLPILHSGSIGKIEGPWISVAIATCRSIKIEGTLMNRPTFMRLPFSAKFQTVYPVRLYEPIQLGDSGAAVIGLHTRKIFGHIVVASHGALMAYIVPAADILANIGTREAKLVSNRSLIGGLPLRGSLYDSALAVDMPHGGEAAGSRYHSQVDHSLRQRQRLDLHGSSSPSDSGYGSIVSSVGTYQSGASLGAYRDYNTGLAASQVATRGNTTVVHHGGRGSYRPNEPTRNYSNHPQNNK